MADLHDRHARAFPFDELVPGLLQGRQLLGTTVWAHLDDGRLLLDTPGLRELQLWGESESVDAAFPEIEEAANHCRFRDCRHEGEPGCALEEAARSGANIMPPSLEAARAGRRDRLDAIAFQLAVLAASRTSEWTITPFTSS